MDKTFLLESLCGEETFERILENPEVAIEPLLIKACERLGRSLELIESLGNQNAGLQLGNQLLISLHGWSNSLHNYYNYDVVSAGPWRTRTKRSVPIA
jgi:hypothetical protein